MQPDQSPSLYDRPGGVYDVATVVDDLIDRVMSDPRLKSNPAVDGAHHRVSSSGFKHVVTEMVCDAAGDPQQYSGRSMGDAHRHLGIAEDGWAAFMDDLHQALSRFQVPPAEQSELVAIVESTNEAIVLVPALRSGPPPR
jgi:hemoglobin